jgi:hypothetical protein
MCTLLCLNLKTKIISCFLICVSLRSYYCALEPGNSFQREMFRSGSIMQWRSLASTYLNDVLLRNAWSQCRANLYAFQLMLREACEIKILPHV